MLPRILPLLLFLGSLLSAGEPPVLDWQVGIASTVITPPEFMWMAGFAARTGPAVAKNQDLFAKALALQAADGQRALIITMDLIGVPRTLRDHLAERLAAKHGLPPAALLINASHTHCGPECRFHGTGADMGEFAGRGEQAEAYGRFLEEKLSALAADALTHSEPARLEYHHARCGFAMNRRLPSSDGSYKNSPYPDGPVDHDVPVLAVFGPKDLRAVLFGYACHNTTMSFNEWSGDYAGYAQADFQADHPGVTALFMNGCSGDQNPYPRNKLPLVQVHGRSLATAIDSALDTPAVPIPASLAAAYDTTDLEFDVPSRAEFESRLQAKDKYLVGHAQRMLARLDQGDSLTKPYPYPVQVLRLGQRLTLVALAGEAVIDYSLRFKRELAGQPVWVAGYCNDVMAYIPSARVRREGGYEGVDSMRYGTLPGPWNESVEERIVTKVHQLLARTQTAN